MRQFRRFPGFLDQAEPWGSLPGRGDTGRIKFLENALPAVNATLVNRHLSRGGTDLFNLRPGFVNQNGDVLKEFDIVNPSVDINDVIRDFYQESTRYEMAVRNALF